MLNALIFNPGSNSLKFEIIECDLNQQIASQAKKLGSAALEGIGKEPRLFIYEGREIISEEDSDACDMREAVSAALRWLRKQSVLSSILERLAFVGVRVVHGGPKYAGAARLTAETRRDIEAMEDLAPLHNQSSLDVFAAIDSELSWVPVFVAFDTAFHRTLPEKAWRYPIERETADRHGVRKFGFHGLSHRYMLERYALTVGKDLSDINIVTLHLESGSSACAIQRGRSIDTTMGLTPLEGLMMGSRSGSIDPAIVPYLMRKEDKSAEDILMLLNKKSGLLGIAGSSLDTRELVKRDDDAARLALEMFGYRVRLAVGAYLAALGSAEAVLFGGGIGEDSPWLQEMVLTCVANVAGSVAFSPKSFGSATNMKLITYKDLTFNSEYIERIEAISDSINKCDVYFTSGASHEFSGTPSSVANEILRLTNCSPAKLPEPRQTSLPNGKRHLSDVDWPKG